MLLNPLYLFPILCFLAALVSQYSGLDLRLESLFYDRQHHLWPYRELWLTQDVIHKGGREFIAIIFLSVIAFLFATVRVERWQRYRIPALYVLLSGLTGIAVVAYLKAHTHLYTPWSLQAFGGAYPDIHLFDSVTANLPAGHAFPSGHASGGFALLGFYFLCRHYRHRYSRRALCLALFTGLLFGFDQQLRGAHMLSHDLFALMICWLSCLLWMKLLFREKECRPGDRDVVREVETHPLQPR